MAARSILFGATLLTAAGILSACSKTDDHKDAAASPAAASQPTPQAAVAPSNGGSLIENGKPVPLDAADRAQTEREAQLELRASAAEARARLAEIELRDQTARALERQQQAAQNEAARAAALTVENANLRADAENAALRANMADRERAVEAERAAYGMGGNVIVVQPPQRHGYDRAPWNNPPGGNRPPYGNAPNGGRVENVGLNRPAVPDLTPPGPPATFAPPAAPTLPANAHPGEPQDPPRTHRSPGRDSGSR